MTLALLFGFSVVEPVVSGESPIRLNRNFLLDWKYEA